MYVHEQEGRTQVLRAALNNVLQKVHDSNSAKFLRTHPGFKRNGELFRLNKQGRDEAKAALKRIFDNADSLGPEAFFPYAPPFTVMFRSFSESQRQLYP